MQCRVWEVSKQSQRDWPQSGFKPGGGSMCPSAAWGSYQAMRVHTKGRFSVYIKSEAADVLRQEQVYKLFA